MKIVFCIWTVFDGNYYDWIGLIDVGGYVSGSASKIENSC